MKKGVFDGILLLTDFDGTIAHNAVISDKNRLAVEYFISEGGLFSLATGRFTNVMELEGFTVTPNTYCVMLNGALLWTPDVGVVDRRPLDTAAARDFTESLLAECPEIRLFGLHTEDRYIPCHVGEEYEFDPGEDIQKIVYRVPTEKSDEYFAAAKRLGEGRFEVSRSWVNGVELLAPGASKGQRLREIRRLLGDRVRLTVAAGDYENDVNMIREADIGYAVGDAVPSVRAAADRVTVPHTDGAIAAIIGELEQVLRERR